MTLSYREYLREFEEGTTKDIFKRIKCEFFHMDDKFVDLGFDGIDEIWCLKCKWKRKVYRTHNPMPFEEQKANGENVKVVKRESECGHS
jgi:hypothetical protein